MKFILFVVLKFGAAPVVPEHYVMTSAVFDDQPACQAAADRFNKMRGATAIVACMPQASAAQEAKPSP
jgi:hypothetical protein